MADPTATINITAAASMQALANPLQQQTLNQPAQHKISHYYALLRISVSTELGREGETEE
jgi:hypothetical protein